MSTRPRMETPISPSPGACHLRLVPWVLVYGWGREESDSGLLLLLWLEVGSLLSAHRPANRCAC
jgi:hypothetical protein